MFRPQKLHNFPRQQSIKSLRLIAFNAFNLIIKANKLANKQVNLGFHRVFDCLFACCHTDTDFSHRRSFFLILLFSVSSLHLLFTTSMKTFFTRQIENIWFWCFDISAQFTITFLYLVVFWTQIYVSRNSYILVAEHEPFSHLISTNISFCRRRCFPFRAQYSKTDDRIDQKSTKIN